MALFHQKMCRGGLKQGLKITTAESTPEKIVTDAALQLREDTPNQCLGSGLLQQRSAMY